MNPEFVKLFGPIVDTQPAYNLVVALWTEMPPEQRAYARFKLRQCAEDLATTAKHIRKKLAESQPEGEAER